MPSSSGCGYSIANAPVLAVPEQRDIVHRPGTVERHQRDDVAEIGRPHRRQRAPHPFGFQLEHADRVAALEQGIDILVVPFERIEIDVARPRSRDQVGAPSLQHRQRLQAKEVELHQAGASTYFMSNCVTGMSERGSR
jgi:hypothetical protein